MGKKKNKRWPATTAAPVWPNMSANQQVAILRANLLSLKNVLETQLNAQIQTPHNQHDCEMDLTDDTSPNNPMNKPGGSSQGKPWQQIKKNNPATQPIFDDFTEDPEVETFDSKSSNAHTKGKQNKSGQPDQSVVQGSASDIKLVVQGSKSVATSSSVTTNTCDKPKPTILASENVTPVSPAHTYVPSLTIKGVQQTALKTEETPKGKLSALGNKQINTRVTGDLTAKPQQYIAPTQAKPVLQPNTPPQHPAQIYYIQKNPRPLFSFNNNYPKGIPKSFLMKPTGETPEPYSSQASNMQSTNQQWGQSQQAVSTTEAYNYPQTSQGYDNRPLHVQTENDPRVEGQMYSPSDIYADNLLGANVDEEADEVVVSDGSQSPDLYEPGEKRLSAFKRLGPVAQPKKPKLTINLLCTKEQSVREVVDETEEIEAKHVPVHLRPTITTSTDEVVMKYLMFWPWKKPLPVKKTVTFRNSKSVMILEQEQMMEFYDKSNFFAQVSVTGYPPTWNKEKVLDILLDTVNGKSFIPCFTEFSPQECKFLVIRSRSALGVLHKIGFIVHKEGHELHISISQTDLSLTNIDFIPKLILKKKLVGGYSGERSLDLKEFTLKEDISHFIYFPLNRSNNQMDIVQLQTSVAWEYLTNLDLSHNKLTSIDGFNLPSTTPRLKYLDLSYNCIERATMLLRCKSLELRTIRLEGNPLCNDYTDPSHYVKVLKLMFPTLVEIDGVPIKLPGEMPTFRRNYCPEAATDLVEKFLGVYFPLLDSVDENKEAIKELYHERATMTITTRYKLRYGPIFKSFRGLFYRSRVTDEGSLDSVVGIKDIAKVIGKWPPLKHDPFTFTVDVLLHDDFVTILKVGGLVRLTAETLAEDEHLLAFTRTFVLHTFDGVEYKIANEMVYWDEPTEEYAHTAFQITAVKPKRLSLKLESTPDEDLKKKLIEIFMKLTDSSVSISEKCLEQKEWNLKNALEFFMKLVKLDDLETLTRSIKV